MSERSAWEARMSTTPSQETLARLWEDHIRHEFETRSTEDTLATMVEDAYVDHVPVLTGGSGKAELREFYATHFIPRMPPDMEMVPISRTIGSDQLVDEMVIKFTHSVELDWMLPGVAPTGRRVEVALVVVVRFRDGKLAHEHILLGPSLGAGPSRFARPKESARRGRRERPEGLRSHNAS